MEDFKNQLRRGRNYLVSVDGTPAAVLLKGKDMDTRTDKLLFEEFQTVPVVESWIGDEYKIICFMVVDKDNTHEITFKPIPTY